MININKLNLLLGKPIKVSNNVEIKIPTVEQLCDDNSFGTYTQVFTITTRELFSGNRQVDKYEEQYPNVWQMAFDKEGGVILGQMLGYSSGINIIIDSIAYWTGLESDAFRPLTNKKIINETAGWIIDEEVFGELCELVKIVTNHETNIDLVAPKNVSDNQWKIWENAYKGRLRNLQKNPRTIADRILVLSVSFDAYIPIDEIKQMTIYHFNKLYEAASLKESYMAQWDIKLSPKFESKGNLKHWKESVKL